MTTMALLELLIVCTAPLHATDSWPPAPAFERPAERVGELPESLRAEALGSGRWRVTFFLDSTTSAERVFVAGTFNDWDPGATELRRGADGRWRTELEVDSGRHLYKFVLDGERWVPDPANGARERDGHGGDNSVLALGAEGRLATSAPRALEGEARLWAYRHDPRRPLYLQRIGEARALVRYRVPSGSAAPHLHLRGTPAPLLMRPAGPLGAFEVYESEVPLNETPTPYAFTVELDGEPRSDPDTFVLDAKHLPVLRTPDWAKEATWYQIMPDRFRNGDPRNDPPHTRAWTSDWYEATPHEEQGELGLWDFWIYRRHYGGDLAGVLEKLDYLESLGVTAIYFNPVFEAESHHKYEATDYRHIDTSLGRGEDWREVAAEEDLTDPDTWSWSPSDELFLELLGACHERGIKVVIDGVWNHVGKRHPAFADVARRGKDSPYRDWFDVTSFEPFRYEGWAGFGDLPVFKKDEHGLACDAVKQHIFDVTRRWMDPDGDGDPSDGIDGWRLDVPMEIAMPFWDEWCALVKSINPDAYLTGEVWDRADAWVNGQRFDAVMNYVFAREAIAWIGHEERKISASELDSRLAELRLAYPLETTQCMMNLAGSHDTDRLASMMLNPDRGYDEENREQANRAYDSSKPGARHYKRARLMALLQMTYVGAPMIYYGDEAGMWGPDDPSNRKPMLWEDLEPYAKPRENHVEEEHLAFYRALGALRREHSALRRGSYRTLLADDEQDLLVFLREDEHEEVLVALNAGEGKALFELPEGAKWEPVLGRGVGQRAASVRPIEGRVWVRTR